MSRESRKTTQDGLDDLRKRQDEAEARLKHYQLS
jgi:hypothetical protein